MFSRLVRRLKHNVPARPPIGQPACRASLTGVTDPDCQRCAFAPDLCESWIKGSLVADVASLLWQLRRHARLERCSDCIPRYWSTVRRSSAQASLPRWQSASSTPDTCGRRYLLDFSGGLKSGSACGASIDRDPHWWLTHPLTYGCQYAKV